MTSGSFSWLIESKCVQMKRVIWLNFVYRKVIWLNVLITFKFDDGGWTNHLVLKSNNCTWCGSYVCACNIPQSLPENLKTSKLFNFLPPGMNLRMNMDIGQSHVTCSIYFEYRLFISPSPPWHKVAWHDFPETDFWRLTQDRIVFQTIRTRYRKYNSTWWNWSNK